MVNITGTVMVFKNVKDDGKVSYRSTVGHKNPDGTYKNTGITLKFPNGKEPADSGRIKITSAKLDHFEVENGRPVFYIFVFEYEPTEESSSSISLSGDTLVFKNTKDDGRVVYKTTIGHKNTDGTFKNASLTLRFPKGKEPTAVQTKVNIKSARLDHFEVEDNRSVFYAFVFDYEVEPAA